VKQAAAVEVVVGAKMVVQVDYLAQARSIPSRADLLVKTAIVWRLAVALYQGGN
jgi:hypothetical protein